LVSIVVDVVEEEEESMVAGLDSLDGKEHVNWDVDEGGDGDDLKYGNESTSS